MHTRQFLFFWHRLMGCLLLALLCTGAAGQSKYDDVGDYTLERVGNDNDVELHTNMVTDSLGRIWIGSYSGLKMFNGKTFTRFGLADGLPESNVMFLFREPDGSIYFTTPSGVSRYTGGSARKFRFYPYPTRQKDYLFTCAPDSNHIYLRRYRKPGFFYLQNGKLKAVPGITDTIYLAMADEQGGVYVLARNTRIFYLKHNKARLIYDQDLAQGGFSTLYKDSAGRNYYYHKNTHTIRYLENGAVGPAMVLPDSSNGVQFASASRFLFAMDDALYAMQAGHVQLLMPRQHDANKVVDNILALDGVIYISCQGGIYRLQKKIGPTIAEKPGSLENQLIHYTTPGGYQRCKVMPLHQAPNLSPADQHRLHNAMGFGAVYFYQDRHDSLWMAGPGGLYSLTGGMRLRYITPAKWNHVYDSTFTQVMEGRDGKMWIASFNGLVCYQNGVFTTYLPQMHEWDGVINDLYVLPDGSVVMATLNGPLLFENGNFTALAPLLHIKNGSSYQVCASPDGKIWVDVYGAALYGFTKRGGHISLTDSLTMRWADNIPINKGFYADHEGRIWVYNGSDMTVIMPDSSGKLSTANRLCFATADGLRNMGNDLVEMSTLYDGSLAIGDSYAYQVFAPATLAQLTEAPPRPYLTGLLLSRRLTNWQQLGFLVSGLNIPANPTFSNAQNYFTFQFAAVDHRHPEYVTFRYRLMGSDTGWQPATTSTSADYTNLPPGQYFFELQAAGINGNWSSTLAYPFSILPPWYATWWATLLWALLGIAGLVLLFQLRLRYLRKKDAMENLLAEQKLVALKAQINPHFLQNVFEFLGSRLRTGSTEHMVETLAQVSHFLRQILYRSDKSAVSLEEEIDFISKFLHMQQGLLGGSFQYQIEVQDDVDTFGATLPAMLLQPIVENALKHGITHASNENEIRLEVDEDELFIYCRISDTGNRNRVTEKPQGYISRGNEITIKRMQLLYRKFGHRPFIKEEWNPQGGLTVTVALPKE